MNTITTGDGKVIDLDTLEVVGRAEGAPIARDPRAKGPEEVVRDPVTGLIKQGSWGLAAGLFALPDLADQQIRG